ncbi:MAG: TerC family protein [Planctomycetes bacterium]|nr:TerC family protein [Planctomycetota bacterium]
MSWLADPEAWIALLTLTALEVVLGIDNIIFISILTDRLPEAARAKARKLGLALAMLMRIALLFSLSLVMRLTEPWFEIGIESLPEGARQISGRDLILILGGLFLIAKSTLEIHHKLEDAGADPRTAPKAATFGAVLTQVMLLDVVFSLDSVITAVGMVEHLGVMITAVVVSVLVMIVFVDAVCAFVERNPTFKMLALSFLVLIGLALFGEGLELHIPKGYVYFAMAFSVAVEMLNLRARRGRARRAG